MTVEPNDNQDIINNEDIVDNQKFLNNPTWQDVEEGRVDFKELPKDIKQKLKEEAYEQTPDDKKYLWDDYGYTPPQTYKGLDKNGKAVEGFGLEGFEELVKKGRIKPKTKVEQDVENLTNLVKQQSQSLLSNQEKEITKKLSELKEKGLYEEKDFEEYNNLLVEKNNLEFQKFELNKNEKPKQDIEYTLDEQADIQLFGYQNKLFGEVAKKNPEMLKFFDDQAFTLRQRNPNASLIDIMNAAKKITENAFNINKKQVPMRQNIIQNDEKTSLSQKSEAKISYNSLGEREKLWIQSAAKNGSFKGQPLIGKSMDDITNIIFKTINK
jgi:hypothetical protein